MEPVWEDYEKDPLHFTLTIKPDEGANHPYNLMRCLENLTLLSRNVQGRRI